MAIPKSVGEGEDGIYKVDTVPPPDGEDDAYGAPTKVGPLTQAAIADMMRDTSEPPRLSPSSGVRMSGDGPPATTPVVTALPTLTTEDDDDLEPTQLGEHSRQVALGSAKAAWRPDPNQRARASVSVPQASAGPPQPASHSQRGFPAGPPMPAPATHGQQPSQPSVRPAPPPAFVQAVFTPPPMRAPIVQQAPSVPRMAGPTAALPPQGQPAVVAMPASGARVSATEVAIVLSTFVVVTAPTLWWLFR